MTLSAVRRGRVVLAGIAAEVMCAAGCRDLISDVATRVRYALVDTLADAPPAGTTVTVRLRPDHAPDGCPGEGGYTLRIAPYRGGKQVASGDIFVTCHGRKSYATGLGSERITLANELTVEKTREQDLEIVVRGTGGGLEIVAVR